MNDPHVVALIYNVDHGDSVIYDEAEPLFQEEKGVRLEVKDKKAWFYLKDHYATEADARKVIEEYIRNWEFNACLQGGPDYFKLKFERAQIEDRNPPPRTPGVVALAATASFGCLRVSASLTVTNKVSRYPSPPSDVTITPDVQKMYDRYMAHRRSREPLAGTAYFCLTLVEHLGNGRPAAAEYFQISRNVLDKIGELSTERGGPLGARKHKGVHRKLTNEEGHFLEEAIKKIIRRVAEKAHAPEKVLPKITVSDLPPCK